MITDTDTETDTDTDDRPVVATRSGRVRGRWRTHPSTGHRDAAFLSVPFAEAPVGDLRFAAPVPRTRWGGVRDAGSFGPTAQVRQMLTVTTIPEPSVPGDDVLAANVFTPAPGDRKARLPVLVWIHGGGYIAGSPHSPWYDGDRFTRSGVVTVSIGYRLGLEGWLRLRGAPDNRGLLDWIAGLRWVQENIEVFGGDPDRVTVAGQSAGGGAVLTLLASPRAGGLFARAVSLSGAVGADETSQGADATAERFRDVTGLADTAAAAGTLTREQAYEVTHALTFGSGATDLCLVPFADGDVLPAPVRSGAVARRGSGVPLLLGATSHEFVDPRSQVDAPAARAALLGLGVRPHQAEELVARCSGTLGRLVGQAVTDRTFRSLALEVARERSRQERAAPTWLYEFAWQSAAPQMNGLAFHCLDLPFWWDRLDGERVVDATGPEPPQRLAHAMHATLVGFVQGDDPAWAPFSEPGLTTMTWADPPTTARGFGAVIGDREHHRRDHPLA